MRIACEGWIAKDGGSAGAAGFAVLQGLLDRGHEIDFFTIQDSADPKELLSHPNFHFREVPMLDIVKALSAIHFPKPIQRYYEAAAHYLVAPSYESKIAEAANRNHSLRQYDVLFSLAKPACFKIPSVPTVSWLQGPPNTELQALNSLKEQFISLCSLWEYWMLNLFYLYRQWVAAREFNLSDILICGSHWSKERLLEFGVLEQKIRILPYPIDLHYFKPDTFANEPQPSEKIILLWLGRIVPRKRLDLILEALSLILVERKDVYLRVFGGFSYSKGLRTLLSRFQDQDFLFYKESIERSEVVRELRGADILVQPSESENFGSAVAEALCCGLPVIVGPSNGTKDYISETSFVFEEYSAESLKATILTAVESVRKNRLKIASDCRKKAEDSFGISGIVTTLESIFVEVIQPKTL